MPPSPPSARWRADDWVGALARYERANTPRGRQAAGGVPIEGYRVLERALSAGRRALVVVASDALLAAPTPWFSRLRGRLEADPDAALVAAPPAALDAAVGGRTFGDVVALVDAPAPLDLDACLATRDGPVALLVAADVADPGNTGALVRTALAGGARGFVALGGADPFHPKAIRTSMGAVFRLPLAHLATADAPTLRAACDRAAVPLIGLVTDAPTPLWEAARDAGPPALVVGGEAFGLTADLVALMDALATIPMAPRVDSYSVNAAAAVALYEWQRRAAGA